MTVSKVKVTELLQIGRSYLKTVIGLLTGHCGLKRYLSRSGIANDAILANAFAVLFPKSEETAEEPIDCILNLLRL